MEGAGGARSNVGALLDMLRGKDLEQYGAISRPTGGAAFARTEDLVEASMAVRATGLSTPIPLSLMLMPVASIAMGDDFCMALMQNGLVFAWGDGDEGKLGLGHGTSKERPTMVDTLLPTEYAEVAKRSENKDALLQVTCSPYNWVLGGPTCGRNTGIT